MALELIGFALQCSTSFSIVILMVKIDAILDVKLFVKILMQIICEFGPPSTIPNRHILLPFFCK